MLRVASNLINSVHASHYPREHGLDHDPLPIRENAMDSPNGHRDVCFLVFDKEFKERVDNTNYILSPEQKKACEMMRAFMGYSAELDWGIPQVFDGVYNLFQIVGKCAMYRMLEPWAKEQEVKLRRWEVETKKGLHLPIGMN